MIKIIAKFVRKRWGISRFKKTNVFLDKYKVSKTREFTPSSFVSIKTSNEIILNTSLNKRVDVCLNAYKAINKILFYDGRKDCKKVLVIGHHTKKNIEFNDLELLKLAILDHLVVEIIYFPVCEKNIDAPVGIATVNLAATEAFNLIRELQFVYALSCCILLLKRLPH